MALNAANMARIAHANGNDVYLYKTTDAILTVVGNGYFDGYDNNRLAEGDVIICVDTNVNTIDLLVVSVGGADVTVVNGT